MKSALKYSNEIDWDCNINYNFRTKRSLKFSKIKSDINRNIIFDFSKFIEKKKDNNNFHDHNQKNYHKHHDKTKKTIIKKSPNHHKLFNIKPLFAIYYGMLFTLVFGFLFFLTISISYASSVEKSSFNDESLYDRENINKLMENYLLSNNQSNGIENFKTNNDIISKKIKFYNYKVKEHDSFEKISKETGVSIDTLYLVNNIKKKTVLKKGTVLIIPNQNGRIIKVNKNDSIFKIANLYGIKWEKIADVNNLQTSVIYDGMNLFIPGSKMTEYERKKFIDTNFIWPVKGKITSYYGSRIDPITGIYSFHSGIDIKNKTGAKIKSVKDGKVIFVGWQKIYGNFVMIKHNDGYITLYAHLSSISVKINQTVGQGEYIGIIGNTGRTTGLHLHFEIRKNGKLINPLNYLS